MSGRPSQARAKRGAAAEATLARIAGAGHHIAAINAEQHHYRITSGAGRVIEFYLSTERWVENGSSRRGSGIPAMFAVLALPLPPREKAPRARRKAGGTGKPEVTIIADASWCVKTKAAGWGAWMIADGQESHTCGAAFHGPMPQSLDAEACALANALHRAQVRGLLKRGAIVMLQSDCIVALQHIRKKVRAADSPFKGGLPVPVARKAPTGKLADAVEMIEKIAAETGCVLIVRHVRGHQEGGGRNWVNRSVDVIARARMRERRALHELESQG